MAVEIPSIFSVALPPGYRPFADRVEIVAHHDVAGDPVVLTGIVSTDPMNAPRHLSEDEWSDCFAVTTRRLPLHEESAAPPEGYSDDR